MKLKLEKLSEAIEDIDLVGVAEVINQGIEMEDMNAWMKLHSVCDTRYVKELGSLSCLLYDTSSRNRCNQTIMLIQQLRLNRLPELCLKGHYDDLIDLDNVIPVVDLGLEIERMHHETEPTADNANRIAETEKFLSILTQINDH